MTLTVAELKEAIRSARAVGAPARLRAIKSELMAASCWVGPVLDYGSYSLRLWKPGKPLWQREAASGNWRLA